MTVIYLMDHLHVPKIRRTSLLNQNICARMVYVIIYFSQSREKWTIFGSKICVYQVVKKWNRIADEAYQNRL